MLRMSSCTITVLPVPAPPNSPILEPFANVQMRSMTLIPVSRISTFACCSDTGGAARMDGPARDAFGRRFVVDRRADHVEHSAQRLHANRHRDRGASRCHLVAAAESI